LELKAKHCIMVLCFRILTRLYVYSLNLRLLVFPSQLSHDWSANSIALVHSIFDVRNWQTLFAFGIVSCVAWAASKEAVHKRQVGTSAAA
jgi:hypothetical protein